MAKEQYPKKGYREVPLTGKLRTADPGVSIAPNDFQKLENLRYNRGSLRSIGGQTKINTSATSSTDLESGIHFRKDFPNAESHVLVAASDDVFDASTVDIPGQDSFSSIFTPATSGNRFAVGPNGSVVLCNGQDTAIWYGNEMPVAGFLDWDSVGESYKYDWIEQVTNSLTTDFATLHRYADTVAGDSNLSLLLHCDGTAGAQTFTDSSDNGFTVTAGGHTHTSTDWVKFGTTSAEFDGDNDYLSVADDTAFDFSAGNFTIDFWVYKPAGRTTLPVGTYYYQNTTDDDDSFRISNSAAGVLQLLIKAAAAEVVNMQYTLKWVSYPSPAAQWIHLAFVGAASGTDVDYQLYINGAKTAWLTDADEPADYTGSVYIGSDYLQNNEIQGWLDEFRVSKSTRWTDSFTPPTRAYGSGNITALYIATPLPAKAFKFYVGTANTTAGTASVSYWDGSDWTAATISGGVGAIPLDATETWTFTDTATLAKQKNIDDVLAYWYKIEITECNTTTTVYQVTADCSMQQLKDLWDGVFRPVDVFLLYNDASKVYNDWTANVFEDAIDTQNVGTYANLSGLTFADDYVYVGSLEQLQGIKVGVQGGFENTNECTLTVEHWDGDEWLGLSIVDGTSNANISFAKSGTIYWPPPDRTAEQTTSISGISGKVNILEVGAEPVRDGSNEAGRAWNLWNLKNKQANKLNGVGNKGLSPILPVSLYYYRLSWTGNGTTTVFPASAGTTPNFTAGMHVFSIKTIPAPLEVRGYKFALMHDDSLFLCNNEDSEPNAAIYSALGRPQVFNGEEAGKLYFGDSTGIVAGCSFSNQYGASVHKTALIAKESETWKVQGEWPYSIHSVSQTDGCVAPESMAVGEVELAQGLRRKVAVWVSQRGVVHSDGNFIKELSQDIRDLFDPQHTNYIGASTIATIYGRIDPVRNEYIMVVPNSSEWCFDFTEMKWYRVRRGSGARLNGCFPVYDTDGGAYMYGFNNGGFVFRMDNGTTFASTSSSNNITSTVRLADIALHESSIMFESRINWSSLVLKAKPTTTATVSSNLYVDGETSGTTIDTVDPTNSGYSIVNGEIHGQAKTGTFHSPEFSITTSDETIGFEPIIWGCNYTTYLREK